jgi:hypothetical protein
VKRWPALQRNASPGSLPIDNNPVENVIQPSAIGKRNWQFGGSECAGYRAATSQTVLATLAPNGRDLAWRPADSLDKFPMCPTARSTCWFRSQNFTQP